MSKLTQVYLLSNRLNSLYSDGEAGWGLAGKHPTPPPPPPIFLKKKKNKIKNKILLREESLQTQKLQLTTLHRAGFPSHGSTDSTCN